MPGYSVYRSILLLLCLSLVISCESMVIRVAPRNPSDIAYHVALSKNTADAYWRFLERHAESRHVDEAIARLAKLLVRESNKEELARYIRYFPSHKHLVEDVLKQIETIEKINDHLRTNLEDGSRVVVRPGEVVYSHAYFKSYVGRKEELEDIGEPAYEVRLEREMSPEFTKLELLANQSFVMVEKFHALVNLYYKIKVSSATPPGEYQVATIIGAYQSFAPNKEYRKGGKKVSHIIEVVKHPLDSVEILGLDFEAVKYFKQQQEKVQVTLNNLKLPEGDAFGSQYMYKYNLANYTLRLEEHKTSQAEACYHLQQAVDSPLPEIAALAQAYIAKLKNEKLFVEYKPVE